LQLHNGHADVTTLLNTDGTIAATYYYDAFGNKTDQTGNVNNNITYAGYQYDKETDLYYLNARYYDSKIARFMSEDTYTGTASDPLSLNLYTYCHNEPVMYSDPTGHLSEWDKSNLPILEQNLVNSYGKEWADANKKGDSAGMALAHAKAEALRNEYRDVDEIGTSDGNTISIFTPKKDTNAVNSQNSLITTITKSTLNEFIIPNIPIVISAPSIGLIGGNTIKLIPNPVFKEAEKMNQNMVKKAVDKVLSYDDMITAVSTELGVPKEMIQAVLTREIYCANLTDKAADLTVKEGIKKDSSTGLGQIFAGTAINAEKQVYGSSVRNNKEEWNILQNDLNNIFYVGLVLKAKAEELNENGKITTSDLTKASSGDLQKVLAYYNGTGDKAKNYGASVKGYYNAFNIYNDKVK
jgi:RHS repeat-associated protein